MNTSYNTDLNNHKKQKTKDWELYFTLFAILCIIFAGIIGYNKNTNAIDPALKRAVPMADYFELIDNNTYAAYTKEKTILNYVSIAQATGYGGPLVLAVATDAQGTITGLSIVEQRETPDWFNRVSESGFIESLIGKNYTEPFSVGKDIDAVSSATITTKAIAKAALQGSRTIASDYLHLPVEQEKEEKIQFGIPEFVLLMLFLVAYIGHRKNYKYTKQTRWLTMLFGMVFLGFIYTNLLTLSYVNQILLGFFPDWKTYLYYYLLLGGVFLVLIIDNKNPYCLWFCPFGAAQECMGLIGGAKQRKTLSPFFFKWAQRILVLSALIVALLFRNPGISSYEIFGTFFDLQGSILSFIILGLVLILALFVRRPWCNFLCPIPPIEDFIKYIRRRIKALWKKTETQKASSSQ